MERQIIVNRIQTPDGTILCSHHRHDCVTHIDKNGKEYMVDGGTFYLHRNEHVDAPYIDLTLYEDSPFVEIREFFARGTYGKKQDKEFHYVLLKDMSDKWLLRTINYILEKKYQTGYDRINFWENLSDDIFKVHRVVFPILIRHFIKKNNINWTAVEDMYIRELEYRINNDIYIPDEPEEIEKSLSFWGTLRNLIGL